MTRSVFSKRHPIWPPRRAAAGLLLLAALLLSSRSATLPAADPAAPAASAADERAPAFPEQLRRMAPADTTLIATADLPALFASELFAGLWAHAAAQPVSRLAQRVQADTGFDLRRDASMLCFFASSDHLSTASFVLTGRFNRERFNVYLRGKRDAQPLAAGEFAYALTVHNRRMFLAFPTPNLAVLAFQEQRLQRQLQVIAGLAPSARAQDLADWCALPPSGAPASACFKDLGMFVGGQQPFALVGKAALWASGPADSVSAFFRAELPDQASAEQFEQLLKAVLLLAAGYFRNQPSPVTTSILEGVQVRHEGRHVIATSTEPVERLLVLPDENKP